MPAKDELKILTILDNNFQSALEHPTWTNFAKNSVLDFEFREGNQWTKSDKAEVEERGQSAVVENEIHPIVNSIIGQYKKIKIRIKVLGRNLGEDEKEADSLDDVIDAVQQQAGYEFAEGDMFEDGTICGMGVIEVKIDFDEVFDPIIKIDSEDVLNMFPDPYSRNYDWNKDAEHVSRAKWVPLKTAQQLYPGKSKELAGITNLDPVNNDATNFKKDNYFDDKTQRVRLVEQEYKIKEKKIMLRHGNGKTEDATDWSKKRLKTALDDDEDASKFTKVENKIKVGIFCWQILLDHDDSPYDHNKFTFVPYFVYRKKDGEPYSDVRLLRDPQEEINKRRSKALWLLSTNQTVAEKGAVKDKDEWNRQMAKPDGFMEHAAQRQVEIIKNVEVAATQMNFQQESKAAMGRIAGRPPESLGQKTEIRSGIGIQRMQAGSDTLRLPGFDNLRRSRLMIGELIVWDMKQYFTEERVFQITDSLGKAKEINFTNDHIEQLKTMKNDIIIEEMPDTTTLQAEEFNKISEMLRNMNLPPNFAISFMPMLVGLSQIKGKDAILKRLEEMSQPAPEHPKISLQIIWSELDQTEKASFAQLMGQQELAQYEAQEGKPPAHITKEKGQLMREEIKSQSKGNGGS